LWLLLDKWVRFVAAERKDAPQLPALHQHLMATLPHATTERKEAAPPVMVTCTNCSQTIASTSLINHVLYGCPSIDYNQACELLAQGHEASLIECKENSTFLVPITTCPIMMLPGRAIAAADKFEVSRQLHEKWIPPCGSWTNGLDDTQQKEAKENKEEQEKQEDVVLNLGLVTRWRPRRSQQGEHKQEAIEDSAEHKRLRELAEVLDVDKILATEDATTLDRSASQHCAFPCSCNKCNPRVVIVVGPEDEEEEHKRFNLMKWAQSIPVATIDPAGTDSLGRGVILYGAARKREPHKFGNEDCVCFFCATGFALHSSDAKREEKCQDSAGWRIGTS
jgi:hypothetical protein